MKVIFVLLALCAVVAGVSILRHPDAPRAAEASADQNQTNRQDSTMTDKIHKTDEEWRQELTPEQYHITRKGGTEMAFTGEYYNFHGDGVFRCVCCGNVLFDSDTKYNSGSGWPSFYAPASDTALESDSDRTLGMLRTEIRCSRCGAHLGHLFDDGPQPTGLRYCINSAALQFEAESAKEGNDKKQSAAE